MNVLKNFTDKFFLLIISVLLTFLSACSSEKKTILTIWTDRAEIVSYAEMYNSQSQDTKVVVVYKENLVDSLEQVDSEFVPDIAIGSWLRNQDTVKHFAEIDLIFNKDQLNPNIFYPELLNYGNINGKQYLLPVSFNLPMMIFSEKNSFKLQDKLLISMEQIRDISADSNKQKKSEEYTHMGFAPSWNSEFMYEIAKTNGLKFELHEENYHWDDKIIEQTVEAITEWTSTKNTSTKAEQDFQFKYLYTPDYKQIDAERSFFAYTNSSSFFKIPEVYFDSIDFRWLSKDKTLITEDNLLTLGIVKSSNNFAASKSFISWLLNADVQANLIKRNQNMHLDKNFFGIASGFSSIIYVNEYTYPIIYTNLLGKIPPAESIRAPNSIFPERWSSLKEKVLIPYLEDATRTPKEEDFKLISIPERIDNWKKQFN